MSYIGNPPSQIAFLTDTFSGNSSTTAFTMSVAPAGTTSMLVAVTGVVQDPSTYSVVGTTLTFSQAPPTGTGNISVRYLGIPASGVTTTAYRTVTEFTATAGQTTFTPPSYTVGFINVYRNGVLLGSADYTATNGTTVVLASAASVSDLVTIESFYVSSVLNAIPATAGAVNSTYLAPNLTVTGNLNMTGGTKYQVSGVPTNALAWVNFNGLTTVTVNSSYNISSVTRNSAGDYTLAFSTVLTDANYAACISGTVDVASTSYQFCAGIRASSGAVTTKTTSSLRVLSAAPGGSSIDSQNMNVAVFGN